MLDAVDRWRPGWALCAVGGGPADFVDTDPRNGGDASRDELMATGVWPTSYGQQSTPSGGTHDVIVSLGSGKGTPRPGVDLQGGRPDGTGRGFVFISPTVRQSKVDGALRAYRWVVEPDMDKLAESIDTDDSGTHLAGLVTAKRTPTAGGPPRTGVLAEVPEVVQRVQALSDKLRAAPEGEGNDLAASLAYMAGQYVGAGQIDAGIAAKIMHSALDDWEYRRPATELTMRATIERQIDAGAGNPRPWTATAGTAREAGQHRKPGHADDGQLIFTDAGLAELVAAECLAGRCCQAGALGWLQWNGCRWEQVDIGAVIEIVRQYVIAQYSAALKAEADRVAKGETNEAPIKGWHRAQSDQRLKAIVGLAGNIDGVRQEGKDFDTHHDLLNTPNGVLDLATGTLRPHDRGLLLTKVTAVNYVPGATHPAWTKALEAIPQDSIEWLQARLGQAVTGYPTDDDRMVLLSGGGSNGKTTIMDTAFKALGSYGAAVPSTLLLMGRQAGAATPEKMTLRGVRLAYIEETPEDRHLDVNALKQVIGTPTMQGRALYKDFLEFDATHSLFLNTNYPPRVVETDHGTWRRLVRLDFPYRFVGPGTLLEKACDRPGDPTLKAVLRSHEAREAALAWMVEGARRWYGEGRSLAVVADPATVKESTRAWQHESDLILRYLDERTVFDRDSFVTSADLYFDFCRWTEDMGCKAFTHITFMARLKDHSALPGYVAAKRVVLATTPGRSAPPFRGGPVKPGGGESARSIALIGIRYK